ncbi:hypothetical protein FS837_005869, partial [Tulasnella sp. UAMH 9824]
DLPRLDEIFTSVESYPNMTIEYLEYSKIGKVMRRISMLTDIPGDDEFRFRERAGALLGRWLVMVQPKNSQTSQM